MNSRDGDNAANLFECLVEMCCRSLVKTAKPQGSQNGQQRANDIKRVYLFNNRTHVRFIVQPDITHPAQQLFGDMDDRLFAVHTLTQLVEGH